MDLLISFLLAILPILVIFVGLVFLKQSGTLMGFVGWILTVIIAVLFFSTSPAIALLATANGILASFGISLMVLFTILQVTMMDVTGAITSISEYIRLIAAERYEQVMLLNVGLGSFLVSIGATPVTMLPPIMLALGFSPVAAIALPCLGYDPLTSFSLLAVPITLPAQIFNLDLAAFGSQISLFLPVISTGFAFGMLYVADGWSGDAERARSRPSQPASHSGSRPSSSSAFCRSRRSGWSGSSRGWSRSRSCSCSVSSRASRSWPGTRTCRPA